MTRTQDDWFRGLPSLPQGHWYLRDINFDIWVCRRTPESGVVDAKIVGEDVTRAIAEVAA